MEGEREFDQMWTEAQLRFEDTTKKPLKQAKNRSLDDVLSQLEERFNPRDPKDGAKKARIKELATNVLQFVQLLGGVAAQGASMVFGPANMCFNALSFLMDIPAKISSFYDDLAALFGEISTFMKQFQIYQRIQDYSKVGMELKDSTHKLMIAFVDICAISISVLGGGKLHTFKTMTKIALFDNDSGIRAKLDDFRILVNHQSQISDAVTLEHVLKAEHDTSNSFKDLFSMLNEEAEKSRKQMQYLQDTSDNVKIIKAGQDVLLKESSERESEKRLKEELEAIYKKLSVAPEKLPSFDQLDRKEGLVPGSGSWIKENEMYKSWADVESDYASPLVLGGANGSGKSCLAFTLCNDYRNRLSTDNGVSTHIPVAWYDFAKTSKKDKKSSTTEDDDIVREAIKSMAAQIAKSSDFSFRTKLTSTLKDASLMKGASVQTLLTTLFPFSGTKDTPSMRFVLLFDSLDQLTDSAAKQLLEAVLGLPASRARVVLTGTTEKFESCRNVNEEDAEEPLPLIRVEEQNESDIAAFIEQQLIEKKALQGDGPEFVKIVERIRAKLPQIANGNFDNVSQVINRVTEAIESGAYMDDIDVLIEDGVIKDATAMVKANVKELNDSLSVQEIEQLNDLLAWALYAYAWLSVPGMTAALFIRTKRVLLQSLEDKITSKYSSILQIHNEAGVMSSVRIRNEDFQIYFGNSPRRRKPTAQIEEGNTDPKISMTIRIDSIPLSKVQRFFWDLNEELVMNKFSFAAANSVSEPTLQVGANAIDSHLLITSRIFEILLNPPNDETSTLSNYALTHLMDHLETLQEMNGDVEIAERAEIVDSMITLFQSGDTLEQHLTSEFLTDAYWLHSGIKTIQSWLNDSAAVQKLNRKPAGWCRRATEDKMLPMQELAAKLARQWLWDRSRVWNEPYAWINVYVLRMEEQEIANTTTNNAATSDNKDGASDTSDDAVKSNDDNSANKEKEEGPADEQKFGEKIYTDEEVNQEKETAASRIEKTADWALKVTGLSKDSIYYERLGLTYDQFGDLDKSTEAFLKAKEFPDSNWKISLYLANTYAFRKNMDMALQEMETVLTFHRNKADRSQEEHDQFVTSLVQRALWHSDLQKKQEAIQDLEEAIRLDERHYQAYFVLFQLYRDSDQMSKALGILQDMQDNSCNQYKDLTKLSSAILEFSRWNVDRDFVESLFQTSFEVAFPALQSATSYAQQTKKEEYAVDLHLIYGTVLAQYRPHDVEECLEQAVTQWSECSKLGMKSQDWSTRHTAVWCARHMINHHFTIARASRSIDSTKYEFHVQRMEALADETFYPDSDLRPLRLPLAFFHGIEERPEKARELVKNLVVSGISLLSDTDPDNDAYGFKTIANALMHINDELNALSAWSLMGPPQRYFPEPEKPLSNGDATDSENKLPNGDTEELPPVEPLGYSCDGSCRKEFQWADSMWFCKVCYDVNFCDECLEKVKNGTQSRYVCSADHQWLLVSSLADEFQETGKGRVRVGGEIKDGRRIGGNFVAVDAWLNDLKDAWNIERIIQKETEGGTT